MSQAQFDPRRFGEWVLLVEFLPWDIYWVVVKIGILEKKMETTVLGLYTIFIPFFSGTLNIRCRIIIGIQKGTLILTTTPILLAHVPLGEYAFPAFCGVLWSLSAQAFKIDWQSLHQHSRYMSYSPNS